MHLQDWAWRGRVDVAVFLPSYFTSCCKYILIEKQNTKAASIQREKICNSCWWNRSCRFRNYCCLLDSLLIVFWFILSYITLEAKHLSTLIHPLVYALKVTPLSPAVAMATDSPIWSCRAFAPSSFQKEKYNNLLLFLLPTHTNRSTKLYQPFRTCDCSSHFFNLFVFFRRWNSGSHSGNRTIRRPQNVSLCRHCRWDFRCFRNICLQLPIKSQTAIQGGLLQYILICRA